MASWQDYIHQNLLVELPSQSTLVSAAILGHDGSPWAKSDAFVDVTAKEIEDLNTGIQHISKLGEHGLFFGGVKYMVISSEENVVVRGKKDKGGIVIKKTGSAYVVGIYNEPTTAGECSLLVETVGDYLLSTGL